MIKKLAVFFLFFISFKLEGSTHAPYDYEDKGPGISETDDTPVPTVTMTSVSSTAVPIFSGFKVSKLKAVLNWQSVIPSGLGVLLALIWVFLSDKDRRVFFKHLCWTWLCGGKKKEALLSELLQLTQRIEQAKQDEEKVQKQLMDSVLAHGNARTETRAMKVILEEVEKSLASLRKLLDLNLSDAQILQDGTMDKDKNSK